jgi:hypothetical protein
MSYEVGLDEGGEPLEATFTDVGFGLSAAAEPLVPKLPLATSIVMVRGWASEADRIGYHWGLFYTGRSYVDMGLEYFYSVRIESGEMDDEAFEVYAKTYGAQTRLRVYF